MEYPTLLKNFFILSTLTVASTQVYKEIISDVKTQKVSVLIAWLLAFVTGTSLLIPLGFSPSETFQITNPFLTGAFAILFFLTDLAITGLLASKGSNFMYELLQINKEVLKSTAKDKPLSF